MWNEQKCEWLFVVLFCRCCLWIWHRQTEEKVLRPNWNERDPSKNKDYTYLGNTPSSNVLQKLLNSSLVRFVHLVYFDNISYVLFAYAIDVIVIIIVDEELWQDVSRQTKW